MKHQHAFVRIPDCDVDYYTTLTRQEMLQETRRLYHMLDNPEMFDHEARKASVEHLLFLQREVDKVRGVHRGV